MVGARPPPSRTKRDRPGSVRPRCSAGPGRGSDRSSSAPTLCACRSPRRASPTLSRCGSSTRCWSPPAFEEALRVIVPGGLYVVCATQTPAADDEVGKVLADMSVRVDQRRGASRPRGVTSEEVLGWAGGAGFTGTSHQLERRWHSSPSDELGAIDAQDWPAMRELDEAAIEEVTRPAIEALSQMPDKPGLRRATSDLLVLKRP